ncbi:MAG: hypothetical protein ACRETR_02870 [Steroidobacteraceae bacterium]
MRDWICGGCGVWHDRDINSAINILVSGRNVGLQGTEIPSLEGGEDVKGVEYRDEHLAHRSYSGADRKPRPRHVCRPDRHPHRRSRPRLPARDSAHHA